MKKNALQIITLILCAVLLVMNVRQGRKLEEYKSQLSDEISNKYTMLNNDLQGIASRVEHTLEEGAKLVSYYELQASGLVEMSRSLRADMSVTLKEWREDTTVILLVKMNGQETSLPMVSVGNGEFTRELLLPTEENCELWMDVTITSGGMTHREELGGWSELSMLLPVQMRSWGGSSPVYENGLLNIGHHSGDLERWDGEPAKVSDVCYRLYVNDEKVKEEARCENWLQQCAGGDEVRLALFCRDEYGLGYEFTMMEFICDENAGGGTGAIAGEGTVSPILSWD